MVYSSHWLVIGLLLIAAAGFASLGRWQLDRAEVNRAIEQSFAAAIELPVLQAPIEVDAVGGLRYRLIQLRGRYVADSQVLLDNMTYQGQAGYQVLAPFEIGSDRLVLVNRGWIPAAADRSQLPDISMASEIAAVSGRVDRLPLAALKLDTAEAGQGAVTVLSFPDIAEIEAALDLPLYPFQVLLDEAAADGYLRDWAPPADRDERNIAYAVQWFGLCALALVIAIGFVWKRAHRPAGRET